MSGPEAGYPTNDYNHYRSSETRHALLSAALQSLRELGYAGTSARSIATRAGCNQGLVFYHYGSVRDLLVASLDLLAMMRLSPYNTLAEEAPNLADLVNGALALIEEDLAQGNVKVLLEMIGASASVPGLAPKVAEKLVPWREVVTKGLNRTAVGSPLLSVLSIDDLAHVALSLFIGLEMLAPVGTDRARMRALAAQGRELLGARATTFSGPF